jgi:hypothetical protein
VLYNHALLCTNSVLDSRTLVLYDDCMIEPFTVHPQGMRPMPSALPSLPTPRPWRNPRELFEPHLDPGCQLSTADCQLSATCCQLSTVREAPLWGNRQPPKVPFEPHSNHSCESSLPIHFSLVSTHFPPGEGRREIVPHCFSGAPTHCSLLSTLFPLCCLLFHLSSTTELLIYPSNYVDLTLPSLPSIKNTHET